MPSSATTVFVIIAVFVVIVVVLVVRAVQQSERYRALKKLCQLDAKELDAYFASYGKIFDDNTMISTLGDFQQGKPPQRDHGSAGARRRDKTAVATAWSWHIATCVDLG